MGLTNNLGRLADALTADASLNVGVGATPNASYKLDAAGTGRFQDNLLVSKNQNAATTLTISNTTSGTASQTQIQTISDATSGYLGVGKASSTYAPYKIVAAKDAYIYNNTVAGDIAILNDFATGQIKLAAGGSSTAHMTIASTGAATFSSSVTIGGAISLSNNNVFPSGAGIFQGTGYLQMVSGANGFTVNNNANTVTNVMVTNAGLVGIGTASPNAPLSVVTNSAANGINIFGRSADNFGVLRFQSNNGATTYSTIYTNAIDLIFENNAAERARIKSTGQLQLNNYTSTSAFTGTAVGYLGFDASGNILSSAAPAGGSMAIGGAITSATAGSVLFAGTSGVLAQNNANFFWDNTNTRLGIGTTGPAAKLHVNGGATAGVRITNAYLHVSADATFYLPSTFHELNSPSGTVLVVRSSGATPAGVFVVYDAASPNGTGNSFYRGLDSTTSRFELRSNGGLANFQANNVNLSDARTKKDIIPLESYWNKFKAIEIVKFKYKDQTHDDFNIGLIAQQLESIAPEFVDIDGWDDEDRKNDEPLKSVYTADLYHATIKVLQEAMIKIEDQENRIKYLESLIVKN